MTVLARAAAMMGAASPQELAEMAPAERARFADLMRHWLTLAEPACRAPRSGVLKDLGTQGQEWR